MVETHGNGRALEGHVKALLARRSDYKSVRGLARAAAIQPNTLINWFSNKTSPRTAELSRVAGCLDVSVSELWDVYEGRELLAVSAEAVRVIERAVERGVAAALARLREEGRL